MTDLNSSIRYRYRRIDEERGEHLHPRIDHLPNTRKETFPLLRGTTKEIKPANNIPQHLLTIKSLEELLDD